VSREWLYGRSTTLARDGATAAGWLAFLGGYLAIPYAVHVRRVRNLVGMALGLVGLAWIVRATRGIPSAMGASPSAIRSVAAGAANYRDGRFHNTEPGSAVEVKNAPSAVLGLVTKARVGLPAGAIPLATPLAPADAGGLAVTWYGHAGVLLEIDGYRVLTDPVWSERCSPSPAVGPARLHPAPAPLATLPPLDAIVISHDHYDHLDEPTVRQLVRMQHAPFVVPLGIGAHLRSWGVPQRRVIELGWGQDATVADGLTLSCTEARHFSGRGLARNTTLWASWVIAGPSRRAFFGGDSGYTRAFAEIGTRFGSFDVAVLPIGAYNDMWHDIHMNPEEAVAAHGDLRGRVLVPIHWATFNLAFHPWSEPVERLVAAAEDAGAAVAVPMPGQRLDLSRPVPLDPWWKSV
jgi:L-ascorbate metabolism protein UlaG (beta-lactamase superfamily)